MSETPEAEQPTLDVPKESIPTEVSPKDDEVGQADRLFGAFAIGVMALLLLCIVLVLVASGNAPAGL